MLKIFYRAYHGELVHMTIDKECYLSTDIEADGPIPGEFSMLSFASVAIVPDKGEIGSFSSNLHRLPSAGQDEGTMTWWENHPEAYKACRRDLQEPGPAMHDYFRWMKHIADSGYRPVFVGYPATYDFMFIYWYLMFFVGECPFGFQGLDMKSYAMAKLGTSFKGTIKKVMPESWFSGRKHTHRAIDDAREQGELFMAMLGHKA